MKFYPQGIRFESEQPSAFNQTKVQIHKLSWKEMDEKNQRCFASIESYLYLFDIHH